MARFFGRYEHSLDPKGRVILPSKFRFPFEGGGFLTHHLDRCLALWTPEQFDQQMVQMEHASIAGKDERNLARLWASTTQEIEIDKQGRLVIPQSMREFARLDSDVLVHGAIDRVELWSPEQWAAKVQPVSRQLTEDEDDA